MLSAAETNPLQRLCSMGVGRFVYIDKMFSRRFVESIINKRNTPTPCRDLSPPPLGGVYPPCTTPHYHFQCETKRILLCAVWKESNWRMRIAAHSVLVWMVRILQYGSLRFASLPSFVVWIGYKVTYPFSAMSITNIVATCIMTLINYILLYKSRLDSSQ